MFVFGWHFFFLDACFPPNFSNLLLVLLLHITTMATVYKQQKSKKDKAEGVVAKSSEDKPVFKNKQRVLLLSSRGITFR